MAEPSMERRMLAHLLNTLPDEELRTARAFLEFLHTRARQTAKATSPASLPPFEESALPQSLRDAPFDDEPMTPEEHAAVEEAYAEIGQGEFLTQEDFRRALGL